MKRTSELKKEMGSDAGVIRTCYGRGYWTDQVNLESTTCWNRTRDDRPARVVMVNEDGVAELVKRPDSHLGSVGGE